MLEHLKPDIGRKLIESSVLAINTVEHNLPGLTKSKADLVTHRLAIGSRGEQRDARIGEPVQDNAKVTGGQRWLGPEVSCI